MESKTSFNKGVSNAKKSTKDDEDDYGDDFEDYDDDFEAETVSPVKAPVKQVTSKPSQLSKSSEIDELKKSIEIENNVAMQRISNRGSPVETSVGPRPTNRYCIITM
jgi:CRISPR/Cas system CSM-associated protein Csm3 (group 7 of RAMP superfamily)